MAGATAASAQAARTLGSKQKTLFWVASTTPCDKNLKVDLGAMKDQVQWFKHQGADGIVVLGTTGEYPSFSVAERKAVMDVVGKNKDGMNIILSPGTPNFPETIELGEARRRPWRRRPAGHSALLLQEAGDGGPGQILFAAVRCGAVEPGGQSLSHPRHLGGSDHHRTAQRRSSIIPIWRASRIPTTTCRNMWSS